MKLIKFQKMRDLSKKNVLKIHMYTRLKYLDKVKNEKVNFR